MTQPPFDENRDPFLAELAGDVSALSAQSEPSTPSTETPAAPAAVESTPASTPASTYESTYGSTITPEPTHEPVAHAPEDTTPVSSWAHETPEPPTWAPPVLPPPPAPVKRGSFKTAIVVGVVVGLASGAGGYTIAEIQANQPHGTITLPSTKGDTSVRPSNSIAGIAKAVLPTVVSIDVKAANGAGTGSGFVIRSTDKETFILTNNHVVSEPGANPTINVVFQDQTEVPATIVGVDTAYDLAVIKVAQGGLPVAVLGNSDDVVVGDATIAIGSPLGLTGTVTSGIVSALNRPVTAGGSGDASFINAIQTDAAVNPGNSGGPLVNSAGEVIGINSAIATMGGNMGGQSGSIGLGFSIPINQAKRVAEELMTNGKSSHPVIGVQLDMNYAGKGANVLSVVAGSPAEKAGIKANDVITKIDDVKISTSTELVVRIRSHVPGDVVTLTLASGSTVKVTLGSEQTK